MKAHLLCLFVLAVWFSYSFAAEATQPTEAPHNLIATHYSEVGAGPLTPEEDEATADQNERRHGKRWAIKQYFNVTSIKKYYGMDPNDMSISPARDIAIVVPFGASGAEADLAVFSTKYGLPAATTANGKFVRINQTGGTTYPPDDTTTYWTWEAHLGTQTLHAFGAASKLILVVCNSASFADLWQGLQTVINYGGTHKVIALPWGFPEGSWVSTYDPTLYGYAISYYGAMFAPSGNSGGGGAVPFPAASKWVNSVGGTTAYTNADFSFNSEEGWSGSGGGCSAYLTCPQYQQQMLGFACGNSPPYRSVPDIAFAADVLTGLKFYLSPWGPWGTCTPPNCYWVGGGTSLAAYIAAGRNGKGPNWLPQDNYSSYHSYRDVTVGSNGAFSCAAGLDKVTGMGPWYGNK